MKHILPILTLTTLTAAAFADASAPAAAAPAGLSYNRVGISRSGQDNSLSVSTLLGSSNFLATVETISGSAVGMPLLSSEGKQTGDLVAFSLGYVFKNVVSGIDATLTVGGGSAAVGSQVGINLRRSLSEVLNGLEVAIGYKEQKTDSGDKGSAWTYELAYNINKQYSVAYGLTTFGGDVTVSDAHTVSVRYNF